MLMSKISVLKHWKIGSYWSQENAKIEYFYHTLGNALKIFNVKGKIPKVEELKRAKQIDNK